MRFGDNYETNGKTKKLCSGFSLLDERDKEHMFGILQALLFATLRMEIANNEDFQVTTEKGEKKK